MKTLADFLPILLALAALGQGMIAVLNLFLARLLHWEEALTQMPLLLREVFHVHKWFISATLAIFAVLTWRFAPELVSSELGRWLAGSIAAFWGFRTVLQVAYYSSTHWRGQPARFTAHLVLLAVYGGFTLVYGLAALGMGGAR
jgi:hypothetical protein